MSILCSRCGKPAILLKTWDEKITTGQGVSVIKHEQYVCPDNDCQTIVEAQHAEKRKLAEERELASKVREEQRVAARTNASKKISV